MENNFKELSSYFYYIVTISIFLWVGASFSLASRYHLEILVISDEDTKSRCDCYSG